MILVVADTSPVHYLVQIGAIDVLARLLDRAVTQNPIILKSLYLHVRC